MSDETPPDAEPTRERAERVPRASVLLKATVEQFGAAAVTTHRVRDLSTGGMRIDQAHLLRHGATILVTVGALEAVGATVVWLADGWAGLKFATSIDPDAARARAVITPKADQKQRTLRPSAAAPLKAGWAGDMRNPYRR
ncbi:PilZ domain-containing protein [Sphingomonas aerophila]|jgi:hypothetical protein|uniref:PilZ domain-containing protein n=1 Tax=Sphingomonas aerophila TaxID=1344948 RepID=A0A7W9BDX8_9SPHN|nr:PilZ domain-containing protein [Sphingomonas aerophila]MBB5715184.1 hypothetical protein [Sphingomonas aerophila]